VLTAYSHDAVRNLTAATDPAGRTSRYGYYADGVLRSGRSFDPTLHQLD
jgi:YD repeat-containing protein